MTYIVGINKPSVGLLTIIADVMVTMRYPTGNLVRKTNALKTGCLFEGCVYGLAGDANAGLGFLRDFKAQIEIRGEIAGNVAKLDAFVSHGTWAAGNGFKILLGIRSPDPCLYLLDSDLRTLVPLCDEIYTIGSGKALLDPLVFDEFKNASRLIENHMAANGIPRGYYPYLTCQWLSELTLGLAE
ncbi:MAG: hypothetical protein U0984_12235, partial [Prosthecobacter sp.]|nr:hypothetical protein [Prosthecobacter sp.]